MACQVAGRRRQPLAAVEGAGALQLELVERQHVLWRLQSLAQLAEDSRSRERRASLPLLSRNQKFQHLRGQRPVTRPVGVRLVLRHSPGLQTELQFLGAVPEDGHKGADEFLVLLCAVTTQHTDKHSQTHTDTHTHNQTHKHKHTKIKVSPHSRPPGLRTTF